MRVGSRLVFLGLVAAAGFAVWGAVERQRELRQAAMGGSEEPPLAEAQPSEPAPAPRAEPEEREAPAERTYYRYLDADGSLHYVDSLERVPDAFRASAKPMSMGGSSRQSQAPQLTRAESRAPRRPLARAAPAYALG